MSIAITTPTGHIGSRLVARLMVAGAQVTLLTRDRKKVADQVKRGAKVAEGSLTDASFVLDATRGAEALFWLTPPELKSPDLRSYQARLGQIAAEAVRRNKITRVVNLSSIGADQGHGTGPVDGLHDVEQAIDTSAPNVTHLRAAFFMENFLWSIEAIKKAGSVFLPVAGTTRTPMIATRDIAEVAAECLLDGDWRGRRVMHLYGPSELTFDEAAATLTLVLGRPVAHVTVTAEQAISAMAAMGVHRNVAALMVELDRALENGHLLSGTPPVPERRTGTTFEQFAREAIRPAFAERASATG
jgi:uncharacterized protein YbjT (DUF2867 family)